MTSFLSVSKFLENEFQCIYIDLYGFGNSELDGVSTLKEYALGVQEILLTLNVDDAILVGHSFGGRVAIRLITLGYKAKGLVLVDSAGLKPRRGIKYYYRKIKYQFKKILKKNTKDCGSPDYIALDVKMKKVFNNVIHDYLDKEVALIKQECLILWGRKDKETPIYMAKKFKRLIKNSEIIFLNGGHFAYLEDIKFGIILRAYVEGIWN